MRILTMDNAVKIIDIMFSNNVLSEIYNERYQKEKLEKLIELQKPFEVDLPGRLVVLSGFDAAHLPCLETRLIFSGHEKNAMKNAIESIEQAEDFSGEALRRLVYRHGNTNALRILQLKIVRDDIEISKDRLIDAIEWQAPIFPVSGKDLKRLGLEEGPVMGKILKATEEWWIAENFNPDRKSCLDYALSIRSVDEN
jgi:poly(A) polymerase